MARETFPERCLHAAGNNPWQALHLAIRLTRWRMIADLQLWPGWDEEIPLEVRHARDTALRAAA